MSYAIHPRARTTPLIRQEIKDSPLSERKLAAHYRISRSTAKKWKQRDSVMDRSHQAHTIKTTLTGGQEAVVVMLRTTLYLPLDELLYVTQTHINPAASRSGLARCLKRHGISRLKDIVPPAPDKEKSIRKALKDSEPGCLNIYVKYLPEMPKEIGSRCLYMVIDQATRWVFLRIYDAMSEASSEDFLCRVYQSAPFTIVKLLTNNGIEFTHQVSNKEKQSSNEHIFDIACIELAA